MFDLAPLAIGTTGRSGPAIWLGEAVATFTLVITILGGVRYAPQAIPWLVGLVITAAYWFTSSTSFANPAVTLARGFTTTFAGIAINHVPAFIVAQVIGGIAATMLAAVLFPSPRSREETATDRAAKCDGARRVKSRSGDAIMSTALVVFVVQIIAGIVGGIAAGAATHEHGLGILTSAIAGVVGGIAGYGVYAAIPPLVNGGGGTDS